MKACNDDLRTLMHGAFMTGCRYGELANMHVKDAYLDLAQIYIQHSKNNKSRHIPLTPEGIRLFSNLIDGKNINELVFTKTNGERWGKSHQLRPINDTCELAKIAPAISFHDLRHTYASILA